MGLFRPVAGQLYFLLFTLYLKKWGIIISRSGIGSMVSTDVQPYLCATNKKTEREVKPRKKAFPQYLYQAIHIFDVSSAKTKGKSQTHVRGKIL
jgi:hypothetical protein